MRSWGRTNDQATPSWLVKATLIILGTLILKLMAPGTARAVEPGYGRVRFWSGIENTVPLSKSRADQIRAMMTWAEKNAVSASSKEELKDVDKVSRELDLG